MRKFRYYALLMLIFVLGCGLPLTGHAQVSGTGWYLENNVLHITADISDFKLASSSSDYWTTSVFEKSEILNDIHSVVVEEGVKIIGELGLYGMSKMTDISLPSTLREIRGGAFHGCQSLSSITIPGNVTVIGGDAFENCYALKTVIFEGSAPTLTSYSPWYERWWGGSPFINLGTIQAYYSSDNNWSVSQMNAVGGSNLVWHDVATVTSGTCGENATWAYKTHNRLVISGTGVLSSYESGNNTPWHSYNSEITSVTVKNGITGIPSHSFENMTNLQSVSLPSTLTTLACSAFNDCRALRFITIPDSVSEFESGCPFDHCDALTDIYYMGTETEWRQIQNFTACVSNNSEADLHFLVLHEAKASTCAEQGHDSYYVFDDSEITTVYSQAKAVLTGIPLLPLLNHELEKTDQTEATCTTEGTEAYWTCSNCHKIFRDEEAIFETDAPVPIPMTAHTLTAHPEEAATCTASGKEAYWECSVCRKLFRDEACTEEIDQPVYIRAKGHTLTEHPQVDPTYTETGVEAYWDCSTCKKMYADPEARLNITKPVTIPVRINKQGAGWRLEDNVLYVTSNLGDFRVASSSSDYITTSVFEEAEILNQVRSVVVSEGVTIIGALNFFDMGRLKSISLPSTLQEIHSEAFYDCTRLESITIPEKVKIIGPYAFLGCQGLRTVTFEGDAPTVTGYSYWYSYYTNNPPFSPSSEIDAYYYSNKNWTTSKMYALANSRMNWHDLRVNSGTCGENAAWYYDTDHTLTISGTGEIASYGSGEAPWNEYSDEIISVIVKDGITGIPGCVFENMTQLTTIRLPDTLISLDCSAFSGCRMLSVLTIPDSIQSFAAGGCFTNCDSLSEIFYFGTESEWQSIQNYQDCRKTENAELNVYYLVLHEAKAATCTEAGYEGYYSVSKMDDGTLYSLDKKQIYEISILPVQNHTLTENAANAATYTEAGNTAYWTCGRCGKYFSDEFGETEIVENSWIIPAIGDAISNEDIVANGSCGDNLAWILDGAGKLTVFGNGEMETNSFPPWIEYRPGITTVEVKDGVTNIGSNAFGYLPALTSATIADSVLRIDEYAFSDCSLLETIALPGHLTNLGACAFRNCSSLTSINFPASLTNIGDFAFVFCRNLAEIKPEGVMQKEHTKCYENRIYTFSLPATVSKLGYGALIGTALTGQGTGLDPDFRIPEYVNNIEEEAFAGIAATHIMMYPHFFDKVTIGSKAFEGCDRLLYFQVRTDGAKIEMDIAKDAFSSFSDLTFIGENNTSLETFTLNHGFRYLENECYWGDG